MDGTRDMAGHSSAGRDYRYPQDSDPRMAPQQESDPLAELARLIGQTDPFSNLERPDTRAAQAHDEREPAYHDETYAPQDQYDAEPEQEPPPPPAWLQNAQHAQQAHLQQAWAQHEQPAPSVYEPHPEDRQYVEAQRAHAHSAYPQEDTRYDEALYGRDPNAALYAREATKAMRDPGPPYAYDGHEQGYDEYEPEEQGSRRRGGLMTVAAVLTLAVVGTAGAFAYRSYTSGPQGEPPVIRADASPSKVVPPAPSKDPSGKVITDRIGQSGERVVSREEQPVDVASNAAASGPRVVFPPLTQNNGAPPARSTSNQPAAQANAAMSGGVMEEPKKIRTLSIKSDQAESPAAVSAPAPQAAAPAVPVPPRTAPIAPVQTQSQSQAQPQAQRAPAASNGGPMQLSPRRGIQHAHGGRRAAGCHRIRPVSGRQRVFRAGVVAAQRRRRAGVLPRHAGQVPERARVPSGDYPPGGPRRGHLLPRHGRPIRQFRGCLADVREPQSGRRRLSRPKKLTGLALLPPGERAKPPGWRSIALSSRE